MLTPNNKKAKIWHVPHGLIKTLAHTGDLFHLPLNSERLKKLTESYVVSNQKLKTALGIEKMPVTAKEGLRKKLASFYKKQDIAMTEDCHIPLRCIRNDAADRQ